MVAPQPRRLGLGERLAVDGDDVVLADLGGGRGHRLAVQRDAAFGDQLLGVAARADAGARDDLCDAFALRALRCDALDVSASAMGVHGQEGMAKSAMNDDEAIALALAEAEAAARAAKCRSARCCCRPTASSWRATATASSSATIRPPMPRCWCCAPGREKLGNERLIGHDALCVARALRDVRRRDQPGAGGARWCSRPRIPRAARCCTARASSSSRPAITVR